MIILFKAHTLGQILQPEQSPTFVETYLEMEKLLDSGLCSNDYLDFRPYRSRR